MSLLLLGAEEKVAPPVILPQKNVLPEAVIQEVESQEDQKLEAWNQEGARQEAVAKHDVPVQNPLPNQEDVHQLVQAPEFNQNFVQEAREAIAEREEKCPDNLQEAQPEEIPDEKHDVVHVPAPEPHVVKRMQQKAISQQEELPNKELVKENPPKNCSSGNVTGPITLHFNFQSSASTNNVTGPITINFNFQSSGQ